MNCPSRTDEPPRSDGLNQSPPALANDLTTNEDLNGRANSRRLRRSAAPDGRAALADTAQQAGSVHVMGGAADEPAVAADSKVAVKEPATTRVGSVDLAWRPGPAGDVVRSSSSRSSSSSSVRRPASVRTATSHADADADPNADGANAGSRTLAAGGGDDGAGRRTGPVWKVLTTIQTFLRFIGPGFIVAVAYIDPGNYSTDIAAGASYRFQLLFVVLLSNIFAIFLQSLSIKLGTVSGRNLAAACRAFLPRWLNISLYILAEVAIIATDIAEVIGTAIALNLLQPKIPLVAGCAISIVDVLVVLVFCKPEDGTRSGLRAFELLVAPLVIGVTVCFCIQLSMIDHATTSVGEVFRGYLPSGVLAQSQGLYQACGILGATVMPHSLYLGSGIVQARLREFDQKLGLLSTPPPSTAPASPPARLIVTEFDAEADDDDDDDDDDHHHHNNTDAVADPPKHGRFHVTYLSGKQREYTYIPSLRAVRHCYKYSVIELVLQLFTFALFVNSAILIVAGASLYQNPDALGANIFAIHDLLATTLSPAAGTIFALALLLSGLSAGVVCTVAGQMVSEGALQWSLAPWLRRLLTRSISILPSIIIAGAVGRDGLDTALNATQVVLSIVLPFVTAPLLWFTTFDKYMTVRPGAARFALRRRYDKTSASDNDNQTDDNDNDNHQNDSDEEENVDGSREAAVKMANSWPVAALGLLIWIVITVLNVANIVLLAIGA